jgi:pyridoxine 5-phosphate synthase
MTQHYPVLGVNIDHVATLRQARGTSYPDPVIAASLAEFAGAGQITAHLREDRRHIVDSDLARLRTAVRTRFNLEMAATMEMLDIALGVAPDMVTLVPERREERTTEGGLDVAQQAARLGPLCRQLGEAGIIVSLFIDPDPVQVEATAALEVGMIELHTGDYCHVRWKDQARELDRLREAAVFARSRGITVAAGHGLDYPNLAPVVTTIPEIVEYNIGHSIISRAVFVGLEQAVRDMVHIIRDATLARTH